jgi:hypothetical protein
MKGGEKIMAHKKDVDAGADLMGELDRLAVKSEIKKLGAGGGGKIFPVDLANAFKRKFDNDGAFAVPKDWIEEKVGYDVDKPMKGRPNALKKKLNRQHADIAGAGFIWHVGNSNNNAYLVGIVKADQTEEKKWKEPAKKETAESKPDEE